MDKPVLARTEDLVVQDTTDEILIYDLKNNKAVCLNQTSAIVWELCDGKHSVSEISDKMSKQLKSSVSEDIVWLAIDQLNKEGLLIDGETIPQRFSGLSRRNLVKKIGFASVVALPLVSSIVAPSAVSAQSICPTVGTCITAGDDICAGCSAGDMLNLQFHSSMDGSCGPTGGTLNYTCMPSGNNTTVDVSVIP